MCIPMFLTVLPVAIDPEHRAHRAFVASNAVTPGAAGTHSVHFSARLLLTYSMQQSLS
jgi:hypothetical protein